MKFSYALLFTTTLLSGCCSFAPNYVPEIPASQWRGMLATAEENPDIWPRFGSTELSSLIAQAGSNNNDVNAAIQRVKQARASATIAASSLWPAIDASAGIGKTFTNPAHGNNSTTSSYRGGLDVAYELDIFGRNRSTTLSAEEAAKASEFDRQAITLIAEADTAEAYIGLMALEDRIALAKNNVVNQSDVLRITQARFNAGTISALELAQQKTQLAGSEASIASLTQQREALLDSLAVLVGKAPQDMKVEAASLAGLTLPEVAPVQPSLLVTHRPDIRKAEAQLAAANYNIGAARADFYPNFQLSAGSAISASPLSAPTALANSLAASVTQPLFHAGALDAALDQSKARRAEVEELYKKAVLTSFQEVQDALAAQKGAGERVNQYQQAAEQSELAYSLAKKRFDAGIIDFQSLLDTQRSMFSAEDVLISARQEQYFAAIDLFRALGGSWK